MRAKTRHDSPRLAKTRYGALACFFLLAGCSSIPEKPIVQTVEVRVPVGIPCKVVLPERPVYELDRTPADADIWTLARNAVVEINQRKYFEKLIFSALVACSDTEGLGLR